MQSAVITVYGDRGIDHLREEIDALLVDVGRKGKIRHTNVAVSGTSADPWAMVVVFYEPH